MSTQAEIIQTLLTQASGSLFSNPPSVPWPLYIGYMPDTDDGAEDSVGALYDTAGTKIGRLLASGKPLFKYGLQLKVRAFDYSTGVALVRAAALQLSQTKMQSVVVSGHTYVIDTVIQTSSVLSMGKDMRRRSLVSCNFLVMFTTSL